MRLLLLALLTSALLPFQVNAEEAKQAAPKPTIADFENARQQVLDDPNNLEKRFQFAQLASVMGKFDEAKDAYEFMLLTNPNLDRVKLELAMVEIRLGDLKKAKTLFEEVLAKNPPDAVKKNIQTVLQQVEQRALS